MASWIPIEADSDFSLQNLPYGVFSTQSGVDRRIGVAVGDHVLDLRALARNGAFTALEKDFDVTALEESTLNRYATLGREVHRKVRTFLQEVLRENTTLGDVLRDRSTLRSTAVLPIGSVKMHLPVSVGNYTDFFTTPFHAQNCTDIVRPGTKVPASFFNMPLGYSGRASSVVPSGTPVRRPRGQFVSSEQKPKFGPCEKLDFEVEFAAVIGRGNELGRPIDVKDAEEHIFGCVLLNDWSARDIQMAESTPLGPFNGKNFSTSISPWIVTLDALEPYRTKSLGSTPLLPYLHDREDSVHDIAIDVHLEVGSEKYHVTRCNTKNVVFSFAQMLGHHTAGGCPMQPGDLIATGTLSGATQPELGCLLEASWNGTRQCTASTKAGAKSKSINRLWLQDGDIVQYTAQARGKDGLGRVGFGECSGEILASI